MLVSERVQAEGRRARCGKKERKEKNVRDSWAVRLTPAAIAAAPITPAVMAYTNDPEPALGSLAEPAT